MEFDFDSNSDSELSPPRKRNKCSDSHTSSEPQCDNTSEQYELDDASELDLDDEFNSTAGTDSSPPQKRSKCSDSYSGSESQCDNLSEQPEWDYESDVMSQQSYQDFNQSYESASDNTYESLQSASGESILHDSTDELIIGSDSNSSYATLAASYDDISDYEIDPDYNSSSSESISDTALFLSGQSEAQTIDSNKTDDNNSNSTRENANGFSLADAACSSKDIWTPD